MSTVERAIERLEDYWVKKTRPGSVPFRFLRRFAAMYLRSEGYNNWRDYASSGELSFVTLLSTQLPAESVAIDCGAHDGSYSRMLLDLTEWDVIAVEPNESLLPKLLSLQEDFPGRLHIQQCAAGAQGGTGTLFQMQASQHSTLIPECIAIDFLARQTLEEVPITIRTLDEIYGRYCRESGKDMPISLLKIDVEGGEVDALQGCSQLFATHRPRFIQIEANIHNLYRGTSIFEISEMLTDYRLGQLLPYDHGVAWRTHDDWLSNLFTYSNFVFSDSRYGTGNEV